MISLEFLLASGIGLLTATGIYLILRARTFPVVLGLAMIGYAVNLFHLRWDVYRSMPRHFDGNHQVTDPFATGTGFDCNRDWIYPPPPLLCNWHYAAVRIGNDHVDSKEEPTLTYDPREDEP